MLRSLCSRRFGTSAARLALYELGIDTLPGAGIASRSANFYAAEMTTILGRGRGEKSESSQFQGTFTSAFGTKAAEFIYIRKHDSYGELEKAHDTLMKAQNSLPVQVERNQEIVILNPFPWYDVKPLNGQTGIFEYRMYTLKPGVMAQWAHRFQQGFDDRRKYSEPLGMWFSEVGQLNAVHHVWHYDSLQHRIDVRNKALTSEIWRETVRDTQPFLDTMWSRILRPTKPLDIL